MSIVKMSKLKLVGMAQSAETILNTLTKTNSVEIIATSEIELTEKANVDQTIESLISMRDDAVKSIEFFVSEFEKCKNQAFYPKQANEALTNFFVSFDEFMAVSDKTEQIAKSVSDVLDKEREILSGKAESVKLNNLLLGLQPYLTIDARFSEFGATETTKIFLGTIKTENLDRLNKLLKDFEFSQNYVLNKTAGQTVISVVAIKEEIDSVSAILTEVGFSACPYTFDATAKEKCEQINNQLSQIKDREIQIDKEICSMFNLLKEIKVYADYLKFMIDKGMASADFRKTESTIVIEAYVPSEKENAVKEAVEKAVDGVVFVEFSEPTEEDEPPTLLKNNAIVRQTEFVTEMYSVPSYRELDPSKLVFFFFMLFMGIIMADVGYGVIMVLAGIILARKQKVDNGTRRLWYVIAIGGVFAAIFGALFNSYFGASLPYTAVLPSPVPKSGGSTVDLMTILLLCLLLGVVQIGTGYLFKALNDFKRKDVLAGIFDGLIWVVFFIGFIFAAFNFIVSYLMPNISLDAPIFKFFAVMQMPGVYMAIGSVVIAALTAGRNEKGFGKFSKGFGAVYGIINLLSDILSYARLFGLLLSGMIIASTFNDMGLGMIAGGGAGYVLGGVVILIGHVFNVAMNVLGAYIHDSRLQYIEFFSKFYTGEGRKFIPFGSEYSYIYLKNN